MLVATVESTTLASAAYDPSREWLQLEFCSGAIYQYFSVPAAVHAELLSARSKGSYFNQAIRGRFPYRLVTELQTDEPVVETPARPCR